MVFLVGSKSHQKRCCNMRVTLRWLKFELFSFSLILALNIHHVSKLWDGSLFLLKNWDCSKFRFPFRILRHPKVTSELHLLRWLFEPCQEPTRITGKKKKMLTVVLDSSYDDCPLLSPESHYHLLNWNS